jgi:drug/metabolite transporter (DMT)-like permease
MNFKSLTRLSAIVISLLAVVFWATIAFSSEEDGGMITPMIYVAFLVLIIAIVLVLGYTFKNLASKKGDLKRTFISIGAFVGVLLVSYILADSTPVKVESGEVSSTTSKLVSTGLNAFYILALVAIGLMFFTGYNRLKK